MSSAPLHERGLVLHAPPRVHRCARQPRSMSVCLQVLGWLQPNLTRQFLGLAFHPNTRRRCPELLAQEARYSNANPPHMFRAFYRQVRPDTGLAVCRSCMARNNIRSAEEYRSVVDRESLFSRITTPDRKAGFCSMPACSSTCWRPMQRMSCA